MIQPIKVNAEEAVQHIIMCMQTKLVPMLSGSPGIGKSAIVHQIAAKFKLKVIDIRLSQYDPVDLHGFPHIQNGRSSYMPVNTFPLEGDEIPDGYNGWVLFFDEFNSAPRAVEAAAYKIILDRQIGQHNLHSRALMICAGNLMTDGAIVNNMGTAMQSRLVHYELTVDHLLWSLWASANKLAHEVIAYINHCPDKLYQFKPNHSDKTFACPRSWEFASRIMLYDKMATKDKLPSLAGAVSEGIAREFLTYCDVYRYIPTYQQIKMQPLSAEVTDEPSMLAAISGSIGAHLIVPDIPSVLRYIRRLPMEFQVFALRDACKRNPGMIKEKEIIEWIDENGNELY